MFLCVSFSTDQSEEQPGPSNKNGSNQAEKAPNEPPVQNPNKIYREKKKQIKYFFQHYAVHLDEEVDNLNDGKATSETDDHSWLIARKRTYVCK